MLGGFGTNRRNPVTLVRCDTGAVLAAFRTSMEVGVTVHAEDPATGERRLCTSALLTFVALGKDGKGAEVPPLLVETDADRRLQQEAQSRRAARLQRKERDWMGPPEPSRS
jgi:acyl-CoA hydrolase